MPLLISKDLEGGPMPVTVRRIKGKERLVEASTGRIAKTSKGRARDGGGHRSKAKAWRNARAINSGLRRS